MPGPETPLLLYVEDEVLIQVEVIEGLEEAGYRVVAAKSGAEALSLLAKHNSELRGVVTDINLSSGMDGWEVARRAREANCYLHIVYVSAASKQKWWANGVPGSVMIAKPFPMAEVVVALSSLMLALQPTA
jgi:CheY-like chemotaxis protein